MIFKIQKMDNDNLVIVVSSRITQEIGYIYYDSAYDLFYLWDKGFDLDEHTMNLVKETCAKMEARWEMITNGNS